MRLKEGKRGIGLGGAAVVVAIVLVAVGVGCGGDQTTPRQTILDAAAATSGVRGYRLSINGSVKLPRIAKVRGPIPFTGEGAMDPRTRRGSFRFDLSKLADALPTTLRGADFKSDEVFDNSVLYVRAPFFASKLPRGKSWLALNVSRYGHTLGLDPAQVNGGADPSRTLDQLRAIGGRVEKLGRDTVRGVAVTHYRSTVDVNRYPLLIPPARRAAARPAMQRLIRALGASSYPVEVWIDDHKLVRRLQLAMSFKVPANLRRGSFAMTEELYAFGTRVVARIPPSDQVARPTKPGVGAPSTP